MDANRLTQQSQEALHDAQTKALRFGHTEVDGEHLLLALLEQPDGLVPRLLVRVGADPDTKRLKEQYVSVEHLLIALLDEGSSSDVGRRLAEQGVTRDKFLQAL